MVRDENNIFFLPDVDFRHFVARFYGYTKKSGVTNKLKTN